MSSMIAKNGEVSGRGFEHIAPDVRQAQVDVNASLHASAHARWADSD